MTPKPLPAEVEALADAVLHEGHALYPYRPSAPKNAWRWLFGVAFPPGSAERSKLGCDVLVEGGRECVIDVRLRFLQPGKEGARIYAVDLPSLVVSPTLRVVEHRSFAAEDGRDVDVELSASAESLGRDLCRIRLRVRNVSVPAALDASRDELLLRALVSVQLVLTVRGGAFVSLASPPPAHAAAAAACAPDGLWPILAGPRGRTDLLLCAPIILEDHASVAPESPTELGDGTEIVELLTLGLLARSDAERRESAALGEPWMSAIERAEHGAPESIGRLHGVIRGFAAIAPGARVRLRPRGGADAFDLFLSGRTATVVSIERDFEGRAHLAVAIDDDPGRDLSYRGLPGHRFFFRPDEVDVLDGEQE